MNIQAALMVVSTLLVAAVGPFVAVHVGAKAFGDMPKSEPVERDSDDTTQIPRYGSEPYHY